MPSIFFEKALPVLKNNLDKIHTVQEWADCMGYSRAHFSVLIKKEFDHSPYTIICEEKYRKVKEMVRLKPDRKGRVIAQETGFKNGKVLYKFLKRNYDTSLTQLRKQVKSCR